MLDGGILLTLQLVKFALLLDDHGFDLKSHFSDFCLTSDLGLDGFCNSLCDGISLCNDSGTLSLLL